MVENIREALFAMQDLEYKAFQCALMPTVDPDTVIGVRTPALRALAKRLKKEAAIAAFLAVLPHRYYEENQLHAIAISQMADYDACICALKEFLPFVNNWATCDILRPKPFQKCRDALRKEIDVWLASDHTYTIRFGIEMLMVHFLDGDFAQSFPDRVAEIQKEEYYVNMMIAWYFATALAKQWDSVIGYLEDRRLAPWVHNKTIQKAVESFRIPEDRKQYLRTLRIKNLSTMENAYAHSAMHNK